MPASISDVTSIAMPELSVPAGSQAHSGDFHKILWGTIDKLESLNTDATSAAGKFLSGENEELHSTVLAVQKAELAFELGLQVRNKVVDAYQEIMKMQI